MAEMDHPFSAYKGDKPYVFVSYAHRDSSAVFPELVWLKDSGFNIWYDEGIEAGTEWTASLARAIKGAKLFLYFVSPNSVRSLNCRNEVSFALEHNVQVIAVHLERTELPDGLSLSLSTRQAILKHETSQHEYSEKLKSRISAYLDQPVESTAIREESFTPSNATNEPAMLHKEGFLRQLWRRRVIQYSAMYLSAAWILLQVAALIGDALSLPDWVDQVILAVSVIGLPLVLFFTWLRKSPAIQDSASTVAPDPGVKDTSPDSLSSLPSVVVLPFRARESDELEMLTAEGLTDDITTLLASVKGIKIVPRQAVGRKLTADDDALQIARRLGGRYGLTGSIRRHGDKLRVSTELADVNNNEQMWSRKFDRQTDDIFAIQDEIAKGVVGTLGGIINRVEAARALRKPPDNLQAWELVRRAMSVTWDWRPETLNQCLLDARRAMELDPNYDIAHSVTAWSLAWRSAHGWSPDIEAERYEALLEADEGIRLGFDNAEALYGGIITNWALGQPERAIQIYESAIARRPDFFTAYPFAIGSVGVAYAKAGRPEEGFEHLKIYEDNFPDDQEGAAWARVLKGHAELACRNYAEAAKLHANPPSEYNGMCRVVALMNSNEVDEAKAEFDRLRRANPGIKLDHYVEHFKTYHVDKSVGEELSNALVRLQEVL